MRYKDSAIARMLREKLSAEELRLLRESVRPASEEQYSAMFDRVIERVRQFRMSYERELARLNEGSAAILNFPDGRRQTVLRNSSQASLLALLQVCMRRAYALCDDEPRQALELAKSAAEVAAFVGTDGILTAPLIADIRAEVHCLIGELRRIGVDFTGAERAFDEAGRQLRRGTGDRMLHARLFGARAALRQDERRLDEAAELFDMEIAVRRGLFDKEQLGVALINRGLIAAWTGPLWKACEFFEQGAALVADPMLMVSALHPTAEGLAREGRGPEAWTVICTAGGVLSLMPTGEQIRRRHRWIRGITLGALDRLEEAVEELTGVRSSFLDAELPLQAALVSIDLAAVFAKQGRVQKVREVASEVGKTFENQGVEGEVEKAFQTFLFAAREGKATAELSGQVANFLVRYQWNRRLRFQGGAEK